MIAGREFQFRPVLSVCTAVALAILLSLGNWQLQRLEWKRDLIDRVDQAMTKPPVALSSRAFGPGDEYRPVYAVGAFAEDQTVPLFGTLDGTPGAYLFDPLRSASGALVYVNRGFVPQAALQDPAIAPPQAGTRVEGLLRVRETPSPPASWFRKPGPDAGGYWFVRDPVAMAAAAGLDETTVAPFYIDQYAVDTVEWPKGGTTRLSFRNRHLEYALTWFGLAATLFAVWVAASLRPSE